MSCRTSGLEAYAHATRRALRCRTQPHYWKVDPEGKQLPYIDSVQFDVVENADLLNMKAVAGEIDMQHRHIVWANYPLFVENAEKGTIAFCNGRWPRALTAVCTPT